jgi:hypothetical protein
MTLDRAAVMIKVFSDKAATLFKTGSKCADPLTKKWTKDDCNEVSGTPRGTPGLSFLKACAPTSCLSCPHSNTFLHLLMYRRSVSNSWPGYLCTHSFTSPCASPPASQQPTTSLCYLVRSYITLKHPSFDWRTPKLFLPFSNCGMAFKGLYLAGLLE